MPASTAPKPLAADERRYQLACTLVRNERRRRRVTAAQLAIDLDHATSKSTISKIETNKWVGDEHWVQLSYALGWNAFIGFVMEGDIEGAAKFGEVDPEIRSLALLQLGRIAAGTE